MKKLPNWLHGIERFVDKAIPYMLVILTALIIIELTHIAKEYEQSLIIMDYIIVTFFVIDLLFKLYHTPKMSKFIRLYWIDIIAVFPFYTVFRAYSLAAGFVTAGEQAQKILHETVLLREAELIREVELGTKFSKDAKIVRLFARGLRMLKARFYITHSRMQEISKKHKS